MFGSFGCPCGDCCLQAHDEFKNVFRLQSKPAPLAAQAKLCRRMERFIKELFVFVSDPAVPSDNNAAERSLRHLVISRKISGGTRSDHGTDSKMALASLFGTWRARGLDPLLECRRLLTSPQL